MSMVCKSECKYALNIFSFYFKLSLSRKVALSFVVGILFGCVARFVPQVHDFINPEGFRTLGVIFINLIKMIVAPLIFSLITSSFLSVKDPGRAGMLAVKSVILFFLMTFLSVAIGIGATKLFKPGVNKNIDVQKIISQNSSAASGIISDASNHKQKSIVEFLINIIPTNICQSFYNSDFLQIIFFAVLLALGIRKANQVDAPIGQLFKSIDKTMYKVTDICMEFAPFGIFGIVVWLISTQDASLIRSLGVIVLIVYGSVLFMVYFIYAAVMVFFGLNPLKFYKKLLPSQLSGYLLSSSSAVLPLSMQIAKDKLGISEEKVSFAIPLGAKINMNGSALNLGVSVIFISQLFGIDFTFGEIVKIVLLCTLGAIGTAPVPGASIFLLSGILTSVGLPVEAIGIILAIDRVLDMIRTFGNISGDVFSALLLDRLDNTIDKKIYNS
jgi:Na+/H+-dicarboxylate symporter